MAEFPDQHRSCSKRRRISRAEGRRPQESKRSCGDGRPRLSCRVKPGGGEAERQASSFARRTAEGGCPHMVLGELMDWRQLWEICSAPDNVPIVGLIPLLGVYICLGVRQARATDQW